jgi:uncharacterized protein (DUF927 family)/phage/plasmid primase-like uncharacterized protein
MMAVDAFKDAIQAAGLTPPDVIEPGRFHRFPGEGKGQRNEAGWCKLFADGRGGVFGDYSTGLAADWHAERERPFSDAERAALKRQIAEARRHAEAQKAKEQAAAANKAQKLWDAAPPAPDDHPYLIRKGINANGARLHGDALVIPLRAGADLHSLQFIGEDGTKRYLTGGRVGGCYFSIGDLGVAAALCIAEGFATGASILEATGYPVAVAFNAGNLLAVAQAMRGKFPDLLLILCADDDHQTPGNPGVTKATEAAQAVGGLLALPDFGTDRPDGATDFNDLAQFAGSNAVREAVERAIEAAKATTAATDEDAPAGDYASCDYGGGRFEIGAHGVFFIGTDKDGNELSPRWLCSPLSVVAMTRDAKSGEWGRLLEWLDDDRVRHQWAMPLELLQGDGSDVRRELARLGLAISPAKAARDLLASFLQVWPVKARARCVDRLGWHGGVYVTPAESIGQDDEIVVFQNAHAIEPALSVAGTVDDWRGSVAALAAGNSRLVFALSVAFAGPLADVVGEDSGGFHLRGGSSTGKSTALKVAASVWGDPAAYPRLWRATANGLEGLAALHNDGLLILDELSQIDPKEAGEAAYLLANGQGKARASRTGAARQAARWRLLFLSAGEESLTALMARAGKKANAGQEVRLADIEADAGTGLGAFEAIHDQPTAAAFALAIKDAAAKRHGAVGVEWLRRVVADRPRLADFIADGIRQFVAEYAPPDAAGQVLRVARRFALVAVAGELATHYGLTGWPEGEAIDGARKCLAVWLESFGGTGNREERAMLAQVRAFFEAHGASRFEDVSATNDQRIPNRAGFYRSGTSGEREFLVLPEAFKRDVCQGFDAKAATAALLKAGWLAKGEGVRATQKPRLPGIGPTRCYVFTARMWEGE